MPFFFHMCINIQNGLSSDMAVERVSQICLVDLAGSERVAQTGAGGERLTESKNINLSLSTLGKVIMDLAKQSSSKSGSGKENSPMKTPGASGFINYRDSKLTYYLRDSLGGNAKTIMLATISPSQAQLQVTQGTLAYANQAKNIITRPQVYVYPLFSFSFHSIFLCALSFVLDHMYSF